LAGKIDTRLRQLVGQQAGAPHLTAGTRRYSALTGADLVEICYDSA